MTAFSPRHCRLVLILLAVCGVLAASSTAFAAPAPPVVRALTPASGPVAGGTTVTITGSGFTRNCVVTFAGTRAGGVTFASATRLVALAPPRAAGKVLVKVTCRGVASAANPAAYYSYRAAAPPSLAVTAVVPGFLPSSGGLISLRGSAFSAVTALSADGEALAYRVESPTALRFTLPPGPPGPVALRLDGPSSGVSLTVTRLPEPAPAARPAVRGLTDRFTIPGDSTLLSGGTIEIPWAGTQDSAEAPLALDSVEAALQAADATGAQVRLRILGARFTPAWVLQAAGSLPWRDTHNGKIVTYTIPRWWEPAYQALFESFLAQVQARLAGYASVREVTVSACTTVYGEPFMRQSGPVNGATIKATDYTYADDLDCLYRSIRETARIWPEQRISLPVNPFQGFRPPAPDRKLLDTFAVMDYCRGLLGERCVLGNHSLRGVTDASMTCPDGSVLRASGQVGGYDELYCRLHAMGGPLYFQKARAQVLGSWSFALDSALEYGAANVELTSDYPAYDQTLLADYAARFAAPPDGRQAAGRPGLSASPGRR